MITTNDAAFAERLRRQRHQGMSLSDAARHAAPPTTFESYPEIGYNFRITDLQAAVGLCQLDRLQEMLDARERAAQRYGERLAGRAEQLQLPTVPAGTRANWQSYMVLLREGTAWSRNELMDALFERGVPTRRAVMASHLEPPYAGEHDLPVTERVAATGFLLPMHSQLTTDQQDFVIDTLEELLTRR
jgi:perosamine synthetase